MAINFNQAFSGQSIRSPSVGEALAKQRGSPKDASASTAAVESVNAPNAAEVERAAAPESGLDAALAEAVEPKDLTRAVEQANSLAETVLRATNRSVLFGRDDSSGRVTITIREEVNGKEVTRQIPPSHFLKVVERLRELHEDGESPRGALVDLDV